MEADIGVTKILSDFILKYADKSSSIYPKAVALKTKYKKCEQTLLKGFPDYDPTSFDPALFNPVSWALWQLLPVHFVGSPESEHYSELKNVVDINLDAIVDTLCNTNEFLIMPDEELNTFEKRTPHPDGKRWGDGEQTIGNYYWGAHGITSTMDILRKFGRLDFQLPIHS